VRISPCPLLRRQPAADRCRPRAKVARGWAPQPRFWDEYAQHDERGHCDAHRREKCCVCDMSPRGEVLVSSLENDNRDADVGVVPTPNGKMISGRHIRGDKAAGSKSNCWKILGGVSWWWKANGSGGKRGRWPAGVGGGGGEGCGRLK
jgi:hypothetical protein